jgi:putative selenate reductase molybdopterin-binding subunit
MKAVGQRTRRVDGFSLVKGKPVFTDDIQLRDCLHVKILRSPHAHALITSIDTSDALSIDGVVCVLTHHDLPRHFYTTAGQGYPEPSPRDTVLLDDRVRYVGDKVAIVGAETLAAAEAAVDAIQVEYEPLPSILDARDSIDNETVIHPEDGTQGIHSAARNIAAHLDAEVGDVDNLTEADIRKFENEYYTPYAQQSSIEPHIILTWMDENDRLVIRSSTQVPFHVRRIVAEVLGIPVRKIRAIKPRVGGGFGGKQEILGEDMCAAVTQATGRPARLEFTRAEELYAARSRHPMHTWMKLAVDSSGRIHGQDVRYLMNCGAYGPHGLTVMSVAALRSVSLYKIANQRVVGNAVYTNLPIAGAYRGYGAPQGIFALEVLVDEIAHSLNIDPINFRKMNVYSEGEEVPIALALGEGREGFRTVIRTTRLADCLDEGAKRIGWDELRTTGKDGTVKRGVGLACSAMGSGIGGIDMGAASIKMNEDASFNLLVGATDIGTGSDTALAQIAAEVLDVPVESILVYSSDTDLTPFDTGAYASSTTYISGGATKKAALKVREQILEQGCKLLEVEDAEIRDRMVIAADGRSISYEEICTKSMYTDHQVQIMATASHVSEDSPMPFNATFAEVDVDTETGIVRVRKIVSVTDAGTVINPPMAEGQVEGAIPQSLGMALSEYMVFDENGAPVNTDFHDYQIYTALDMPEIEAVFLETDEPTGPFGAKATAEIPINAPAPAVVNAIYNACGVRIRELPIRPEQILKSLQAAAGADD